MSDTTTTVVFDLGSSILRCGVSNDAAVVPKLSLPCIVGTPRHQRAMVDAGAAGSAGSSSATASGGGDATTRSRYVGAEALRYRSMCEMSNPIRDGRIERPDELAAVLHEAFALLRVDPANARVVVTEPMGAARAHTQTVARVFFGDLKVPALMSVSQGITSLFAVGELSGLVLDVGEDSSRAVAVVDGIGLPTTLVTTRRGGHALTDSVRKMLASSGRTAGAADHAGHIKEALCVAGPQAGVALAGTSASEYMLPDGQPVRLAATDCAVPAESSLFAPPGPGATAMGPSLPAVVDDALAAVDDDIRAHVAQRLTFCGGTAALRGFESRMVHDLRTGAGAATPLDDVVAASTRALYTVQKGASAQHCPVCPSDRTWAGAAIFAALPSVAPMFVTQKDISEEGVVALQRHRQLLV